MLKGADDMCEGEQKAFLSHPREQKELVQSLSLADNEHLQSSLHKDSDNNQPAQYRTCLNFSKTHTG